MKSFITALIILYLAACGQQESSRQEKPIEGRCYVRAALELAYGDKNAAEREFQEVWSEYPSGGKQPDGTVTGTTLDIYKIFYEYAIGDRELTHRNPYTRSEVREYLNSGYTVAIRFWAGTGYHIQCIYNTDDWDLGEHPRLLFVAGDF
jgi:hypothetical protein